MIKKTSQYKIKALQSLLLYSADYLCYQFYLLGRFQNYLYQDLLPGHPNS